MANALYGLGERLRYLTNVISQRDDPPPEQLSQEQLDNLSTARSALRNSQIEAYRKEALSTPYDASQDTVARRAFTTRLFSYIHSEFNFNSPRYLSRFARVSHLVFTPLYIEKTLCEGTGRDAPDTRWRMLMVRLGCIDSRKDDLPDSAKRIGRLTQETLDWLWREAIHSYKTDKDNPSFRGGKDRIFDFVQELFDFSEPFITTKRSVWEMKKALMSKLGVNDPAAYATELIEDEIRNAGLSNRLTNTIEFFWKFFDSERAHFKWTRHARPYQTYTLTHETLDGVPDGKDPFEKTALHAFPENIFTGLFGRYVQGANYLIVPIEAFLNLPDVSLSDLAAVSTRKAAETIAKALKAYRLREGGRELDELVISRTRAFLHRCFREQRAGEFQNEFVGFKCMDGQAYVFSSIRNIYSAPGASVDTLENLFTRTVIVDCGMNGFQRGRLIQNLTEFATERTLALLWVARFRLIHNALNVIQARLSLAVSNYHNGYPQRGSVVLPRYYDELATHGSRARPERQRQLIVALEFLSSCLTILNDVIEGGITDRSGASSAAYVTIEGKIKSIREHEIIGHQTLTDFLHRRFVPAARLIGRTGERYNRLRQRIAEIADLANAHLQAEQRDEHRDEARRQTRLLSVAEFFGEVALGYYGAGLVWDFLENTCGKVYPAFPSLAAQFCARVADKSVPFVSKGVVYAISLAAVLLLVISSIFRMAFDRWREGTAAPGT